MVENPAYNWQQQQHAQDAFKSLNSYNTNLNPSVQEFTPPSAGSSALSPMTIPNSGLHRYMVQSYADARNTLGLERAIRTVAVEQGNTKDVVGNDLRAYLRAAQDGQFADNEITGTLQRQIQALEEKFYSMPANGAQRIVIDPKLFDPKKDYSANKLVNEYGLQHVSKTSIAEAFNVQAEDAEKLAKALRKEAAALDSRLMTPKVNEMRLLEGPPAMKTEFACCGTVFESVQTLSQHCVFTHKEFQQGSLEASLEDMTLDKVTHTVYVEQDTPTHKPVERPRNGEKSHAVEIKPDNDQLPTPPAEQANQIIADSAAPSSKGVSEVSLTFTQPLAVRQMPPFMSKNLAAMAKNTETFSYEFLQYEFGGEEWSPGFYFIHPSARSALLCRAYWLLEADLEPYLPCQPGQHGAKLTAFFNSTMTGDGEAPEEKDYLHAPVFIAAKGSKAYRYFGGYSQLRYSDKLDFDRVVEAVPDPVKRHIAEQLAEVGRPEWVTKALQEHYWPKPAYDGPIPTDSALQTPASKIAATSETNHTLERRVSRALDEYVLDLRDWEKDTKMKVALLTKETIYDSISKADADEEPGLRLWWEYLQCVDYDQGFYEFLVKIKQDPKRYLGLPNGATKSKKVDQPIVTAPKLTQPESMTTAINKPKKPDQPVFTAAKVAELKSMTTAVPHVKSHTGGIKPWQRPAESVQANNGSNKVGGAESSSPAKVSIHPAADLEAAKALQAGFKESAAKAPAKRRGPPHKRG